MKRMHFQPVRSESKHILRQARLGLSSDSRCIEDSPHVWEAGGVNIVQQENMYRYAFSDSAQYK